MIDKSADAPFWATFERAAERRDAGSFQEALVFARQAFEVAVNDRARSIAAREIGFELELAGCVDESIVWFERACRLAPRSWLASLAYYHSLFETGQHLQALDEAARLASLRHSKEYRGLFESAFIDDVSPELRAKADIVRARLRAWGVPWTDAHRRAWDDLPEDRRAWEALPDPTGLLDPARPGVDERAEVAESSELRRLRRPRRPPSQV